MIYNTIIIGSGPAGWTAAIYVARAELSPLLLEGKDAGGQLMATSEVENFPGFPKGILGTQLMQNMKEQALRFNTEIKSEIVTSVDFSKQPFTVITDSGSYQAKSIIISTGAAARRLGLESEKRLYGKGVSACATCDGFFFKGKKVVVVGGGDAAMEEANFLTKFASEVILVHRRDVFNASKIMQDRAKANTKISMILNTGVEEILGEQKVTGVRLKNLVSGHVSEVSCDGVFVAIGHEPNTKLFEGQLELTKGYIVLKNNTTATSVPGVFAAGDVADYRYRQAVTAAGMGCQAAIDVEKYLAV